MMIYWKRPRVKGLSLTLCSLSCLSIWRLKKRSGITISKSRLRMLNITKALLLESVKTYKSVWKMVKNTFGTRKLIGLLKL